MRSIFGLGKKVQQKLTAERFHFSFTIHQLSPWPGGNKSLAIGWQRGKKKRGATRSVFPSTQPGKVGAVVRFNERFDLKASLYKTHQGNGSTSQLGSFKKKCLILAILETDGRTQATAALGRVVIDLAEFAAIDNTETRTFLVACNKSIQSAVGDPLLSITIRCCWKEAGPEGQVDEAGSVSTDTTGSRMTANLQSFLRFKHNPKGAPVNEEQDLHGFDPATPKFKQVSSLHKVSATGLPMGTIPEEGSPGSADSRQATGHSHGEAASAAIGQSLRSLHSQPNMPGNLITEQPPAASSKSSGGIMQMLGLRKQYEEVPSPTKGPRKQFDDAPSPTKALSPPPANGLTASSSSSSALETELLAAAALEASVHLVRITTTNKGRTSERKTHACARRVARTMLIMGPQQGAAFGRHALKIIESHAEMVSDLGTLSFWLSNLAHLRAFLYRSGSSEGGALNAGGGTGPLFSPSSAWAYHELSARAIKIESSVFEKISMQGWDILLSASQSSPKPSAAPSTSLNTTTLKVPSSISATSAKRATSESVIKIWSRGLEALSAWLQEGLQGLGTSKSATKSGTLLRQQVIHNCLRKLDALLFFHLMTTPDYKGPNVLEEYGGVSSSLWGTSGVIPTLEEACLPFTRGLLSFGCGMNLKMVVTRLQQFASEPGGQDSSGVFHLPLLRGTSDLLLMPKQLFFDESVRRDNQLLSLQSSSYILHHFTTDEFSIDGIPSEVLSMIKEEMAVAPPSSCPPISDLALPYKPFAEEALMPRAVGSRVVKDEPGVEFDAESEDEIEGLGRMIGGEKRMSMLKRLWGQSK